MVLFALTPARASASSLSRLSPLSTTSSSPGHTAEPFAWLFSNILGRSDVVHRPFRSYGSFESPSCWRFNGLCSIFAIVGFGTGWGASGLHTSAVLFAQLLLVLVPQAYLVFLLFPQQWETNVREMPQKYWFVFFFPLCFFSRYITVARLVWSSGRTKQFFLILYSKVRRVGDTLRKKPIYAAHLHLSKPVPLCSVLNKRNLHAYLPLHNNRGIPELVGEGAW